MKLDRYFKLIAIFVGASISAQLEYRSNFIVSLLGALLAAGGSLFGLVILIGDNSSLGGWTYAEAMVVVGLFTLVQGCIGGLLYPNLNKIAEAVRTGTMDFMLLKPIDAQFLVSTRNINMFPLLNVVVGLAVIVLALARVPSVSVLGILSGVILLGASLAIVYAIWFMLTTTAFWFVKVENITELFLKPRLRHLEWR
jgi:ABC-2 type transport system permease protein